MVFQAVYDFFSMPAGGKCPPLGTNHDTHVDLLDPNPSLRTAVQDLRRSAYPTKETCTLPADHTDFTRVFTSQHELFPAIDHTRAYQIPGIRCIYSLKYLDRRYPSVVWIYPIVMLFGLMAPTLQYVRTPCRMANGTTTCEVSPKREQQCSRFFLLLPFLVVVVICSQGETLTFRRVSPSP